MIRRAKATFIQEATHGDTNKFWDKIGHIIPNKSKSNLIHPVDKITNVPIPEECIPNYINNHFSKIGTLLAAKFNKKWNTMVWIRLYKWTVYLQTRIQ